MNSIYSYPTDVKLCSLDHALPSESILIKNSLLKFIYIIFKAIDVFLDTKRLHVKNDMRNGRVDKPETNVFFLHCFTGKLEILSF